MKQKKMLRPDLDMLLALLVTGSLIYVTAFGFKLVPPLGPALNVGTGIWASATTALPLQSEVLHFQGLTQPVTVVFEQNGTPHIQASNDGDLFWTIGYLQARFRLTQMDLLRRQGEGRLSEILGSGSLDTDRLELTLGIKRAAETNWHNTPSNSPTHQVLQDYANGVNELIHQEEQQNTLPLIFKFLNYKPDPWTPVDTLVVNGDLTQQLSFTLQPLDYAMMIKALGYQRTMQWFPVLPSNVQHPYDTASYAKTASPTPLPTQLAFDNETIQHMATLAQQTEALPHVMRDTSASNNWAINGPKTASGKALMAGDPHLNLTLPSIWFQIEGVSPHYHFSGVSIPGAPLILIGYNQHISWSMTNEQNQSTLVYVEKTDQAHPHQYFWENAWHPMQQITYDIQVKGQSVIHYKVDLTVHGPIMTDDPRATGQIISIDWMGAQTSTNIEAQLELLQSSNFSQFRQALSKWTAPTLNFVYSDDQGNIGMISPGYYPIVKKGAPWLPLPGTGEADVLGTIPYNAVPQVYDPPDHIVFTANQRPVSNDYPYYIGTTWDGFDNGYRANEIYDTLSQGKNMGVQDMEQLQNSIHDYLADRIVPKLLSDLQQSKLSAGEQMAFKQLESWDKDMSVDSSAASIWWTFWSRYLIDTFEPWWQAKHVSTELTIDANQAPLDEDLEMWTLNDPHNPAFLRPDGTPGDANGVMLQAFRESVSELSNTLGNAPTQWQWGKLHTSEIASPLGVQVSYGPYANGGNSWTLNSASSGARSESNPIQYPSEHGPSWRMIVDWSNGQAQAEGAYPGGTDENTASQWYENQIATWWHGQYYPMLDGKTALKQTGSITWTMEK